jgi:uncharacterized protein with PQ loop repeat
MPHHSTHHRIRVKKLTKRQQKEFIKHSVLAVAIIEPLMTLPQIYEIWFKHQAEGVSAATWGSYTIAALIWLLYGIS